MKKDKKYLVIGTGKTGISCIRHLHNKSIKFAVADTRPNPPDIEMLREQFPSIKFNCGAISDEIIDKYDVLVISPGISLNSLFIQYALKVGKEVIGDIELFAREAKAPIIAITGTNGKTTVTTLISKMAEASNKRVLTGGNIGTPALDLLIEPEPDLYVLELSSFQLQTTYSIKFKVALLLNITEDHIDHHGSMKKYIEAKFRIFNNCEYAIINKNIKNKPSCRNTIQFSLSQPVSDNDYGITEKENNTFLSAGPENCFFNVCNLKIEGKHNRENALAAYAAGCAFGLDKEKMIQVLNEFEGIKHRCQFIRKIAGVKWYNDSKATNVGATLAAVQGLGTNSKNIILILGGVGKDADFSSLTPALKKFVKTVILFGRDADIIKKDIKDAANIISADSLIDVIKKAKTNSKAGDIILFAPACASFDMFNNYEHRGEEFMRLVQTLTE